MSPIQVLKGHYHRLQIRFFGPHISHEDMVLLRSRADVEDWGELLGWVERIKNRRKRAWWLYYLRENLILIRVRGEDPYEDDDPWEQDL